MDKWEIVKKINDFFLHNIRTQISVIVSGIELLDFDEEIDDLRDSINFSAFLLDIYDALMSNLLDILKGDISLDNASFKLSDPVIKFVNMFNSFHSNSARFVFEDNSKSEVNINYYIFKNVIGVLLAECSKDFAGEVKLLIMEDKVKFLIDAEKIPSILFEINNLLEKYRILIYKDKYLEVRVL